MHACVHVVVGWGWRHVGRGMGSSSLVPTPVCIADTIKSLCGRTTRSARWRAALICLIWAEPLQLQLAEIIADAFLRLVLQWAYCARDRVCWQVRKWVLLHHSMIKR